MNEIELIEDFELPLFYILTKDKTVIFKGFGKLKPYKTLLKKGDIIPNYYKSNCHIIEKRGKSKGKKLGLHKEYVGFKTKIKLPVELLDKIANKEIKIILNREMV